MYINPGKTIYKALGYKKPGCLQCYGFCYKDGLKKIKNALSTTHNNKKLKFQNSSGAEHFQLGGSMLLNAKAEIIFQHSDKFPGDFAKEQEIFEAINEYYINE